MLSHRLSGVLSLEFLTARFILVCIDVCSCLVKTFSSRMLMYILGVNDDKIMSDNSNSVKYW